MVRIFWGFWFIPGGFRGSLLNAPLKFLFHNIRKSIEVWKAAINLHSTLCFWPPDKCKSNIHSAFTSDLLYLAPGLLNIWLSSWTDYNIFSVLFGAERVVLEGSAAAADGPDGSWRTKTTSCKMLKRLVADCWLFSGSFPLQATVRSIGNSKSEASCDSRARILGK